MKKVRLSNLSKIIIITIISIPLCILSVYLVKKSVDVKTREIVSYSITGEPKYKVYLVKNNYFEEPFKTKGPFISNLIDYIDIDYNYAINFDKEVKGNYSYYINAVMSASKDGTENNYWTKNIQLTKPNKIEVSDKSTYLIKENYKLKYQDYNKMMANFKKEYGLNFDGELKVELVVKNDLKVEDYNVNINDNVSLSVPLTEQTLDISVDTSNLEKNETVKTADEISDKTRKEYQTLAVIIVLILIFNVIIAIIKARQIYLKQSEYVRELKKILTTYDNIIVNVKELPKISNLKVIQVENFSELLDAHSEVRMPINYVQVKDEYSVFVLINEQIAWEYILLNKDYEYKKNTIKHLK